VKQVLEEEGKAVAEYLSHKSQNIYRVYAKNDEVIHILEDVRRSDDWVRSVAGVAFNYNRNMLFAFERLRTVTDFNTPIVFRAYTWMWLTLFPVWFSPFFASLGIGSQIWPSLFSSMLVSLMLAALYNANGQLDDPFDGYGLDDINLGMVNEPITFMFHRTTKQVKKLEAAEKKKEHDELEHLRHAPQPKKPKSKSGKKKAYKSGEKEKVEKVDETSSSDI